MLIGYARVSTHDQQLDAQEDLLKAAAQIAKSQGDTDHYQVLMARSKNYRNMFDPSTRFMRSSV
ncbi:glycoside hydrolase domain-containing protein [Dyadobacter arcticus]|uniref:Alpha-1,2-mannosidase n=1 Tax=Dyadobacter arcticus TaxID=1078754 RepID=A0ABX0UJH3_9BACT|nr:glycoside hydrolase domain-containing protein [Dyadobacter arcticus]NIJ52957.1 putative alpha-1,2-mannosidase [Dyadobacter arcticus]